MQEQRNDSVCLCIFVCERSGRFLSRISVTVAWIFLRERGVAPGGETLAPGWVKSAQRPVFREAGQMRAERKSMYILHRIVNIYSVPYCRTTSTKHSVLCAETVVLELL